METLTISASAPPPGFPPLVRARVRELGFGNRAHRARVEQLCGGFSAANHFLDKSVKSGLLVPVEWGLYQVPSEETVNLLGRIANPTLQRFLSWARTLPTLPNLAKRVVAFFAPRVWKFSELNLEEPVPIIGLIKTEQTLQRPTAQWGALAFDLGEPETWRIQVDGADAGRVLVPNWFDSVVLARSNADPRWRASTGAWISRLGATEREALETTLATLRRIANPKPVIPMLLGPGPPARRRLVTPPWFERLHRDALETIARGLHGP